ncbi:MAG: hypothetical protein HY597_03235 [Candidatus Omnitrophica bacterium]|nr:hypothetical protein [Candidatus Omnitrophota bacterium]
MMVIMVKKRLKDGTECPKCGQMTKLLEERALWHKIDFVVWADENKPDSEGMQLARKHRIDTAPFYLVKTLDREEVFTSTLQLIRDHFHVDVPAELRYEQGPEELGVP